MHRYWREAALVLASLALLAGLMAVDSIPQDPAYHRFADTRAFLGVPNFLNVASNLLFLLAGAAGAAFCLAQSHSSARASWTTLFLGAALVSLGSGYYHWTPDDGRLVWDRLPMTFGFMGLLVAVVAEHAGDRFEHELLAAALIVGAASVAWWWLADDLRLYIWVQLAPLVVVLLALALFPGKYTHRVYLLYGLAAYVLAKIAEFYDRELFALTQGGLSGHTAKHALAALAVFLVYLMLRLRKPARGFSGVAE